MKQFYPLYEGNEKVSPLVTQLSWTNHLMIMSGCKSDEEREFYMRLAIKERYSKRKLKRQMDSGYILLKELEIMKVLIIGASGFLGGTIFYKLKLAGADVLGTYNNHRKQNDFIKLDVMDSQKLVRIIGEYLPDVVVWTVMNHNAEEEISEKIIPVLCNTIRDTRLIFVSTTVAYEKNMSEDVTPLLRTEEMYNHHYFNKALCKRYGWDDSCIVANEEEGSIYYFDNSLRKCLLKTRITRIGDIVSNHKSSLSPNNKED